MHSVGEKKEERERERKALIEHLLPANPAQQAAKCVALLGLLGDQFFFSGIQVLHFNPKQLESKIPVSPNSVLRPVHCVCLNSRNAVESPDDHCQLIQDVVGDKNHRVIYVKYKQAL